MPQVFDVARFNSLLKTSEFGRSMLFEPSVGSTMDVAREAAAAGAMEGTIVAADEQTAGRGRLGRSWITPPATNLASTLILRPPATALRSIAMLAPLAIVRAVADVSGVACDIKWPNDVQVAGKKVAGILIETIMVEGYEPVVLVGAGINVNFDPREHEEIREIATSLRAELGRDTDREALLAAYVQRFQELYAAARADESPLMSWKAKLVTLGQRIHASWPGGEANGVAEDVDADGALLVRVPSGEVVRVEAGDVTLRG